MAAPNHISESPENPLDTERRERVAQLNDRLIVLHARHPFIFNLLAVGIAALILVVAMLLKALLEGSL
jgi:hypothetical protein